MNTRGQTGMDKAGGNSAKDKPFDSLKLFLKWWLNEFVKSA